MTSPARESLVHGTVLENVPDGRPIAILIFDDPTVSLDLERERRIVELIDCCHPRP